MKNQSILAWHFLPAGGKTQFSHEIVTVGSTLEAKGKLVLCENGLHASRKVLDALRYAPGLIVCRVEISGEVVEGDDKLCGRQRRCVAMGNARKAILLAVADFWVRLFERIGRDDLPWRPVEQAIRDYADEKIAAAKLQDFLVEFRKLYRALDLARNLDIDLALDLALALDLDLALALTRNRALDLALARDIALDLDLDLARNLARNLALDLARNLARNLALDLALARDRDLDLARALDAARADREWVEERLSKNLCQQLGCT